MRNPKLDKNKCPKSINENLELKKKRENVKII